jgi:recombination protein RecA
MVKKTSKKKVSKKVSTLDLAKKAIEKKYGDVVKPMSQKPLIIDTISTRSIGLDMNLGRGGVALGRIYEIYGGEASGKTTLAMSLIAEAQSRGMTAAFIDAEHSADPQLFESMGVNLEKLTVIDLYTGEENLDAAEMLMKTGELDLLVVDSVTALIPKDQASKEIGDTTIALLARLMSTTLLRYVPIAAKNNVCVIFINQTRNKVGGYGNPETTTGGNALKFYATGRIKVSGAQAVANRLKSPEGEVIGHLTKFEIVKNKLSAPFKSNVVPLYYGLGYDMEYEIINYAVDLGIIEKKGSWYYYKGDSIGQGDAGVRKMFDENPEEFLKIKTQVITMVGLKDFYEAQKMRDQTLGEQ